MQFRECLVDVLETRQDDKVAQHKARNDGDDRHVGEEKAERDGEGRTTHCII